MDERKRDFPSYGVIGLMIIVVGEALLLGRFWLVPVFFTPIAWTGYVLFLDALVYKTKGESLIRTRPKEFLLMLPWSVLCWLFFELYNLHLQNWVYLGLPQNLIIRSIGYVWSFATIFPAILETADFLETIFEKFRMKPWEPSQTVLYVFMILGFTLLILPILFSSSTAKYMIALIWVGFAFLLEPMNHLVGGRSLFAYFERGELKQLLGLTMAGLVCGLLWEFWNYWAEARWIYNVPFTWAGPKIFEMPLLGFLGFIPFAVECHAMQNYLMSIAGRRRYLSPSLSS